MRMSPYVPIQEHQKFQAKTEGSQDSDFGFIMIVYENFFFTILKHTRQNKQIVVGNNITKKKS